MQSTETITITKAEYEQLQAQNLQLMHRLSQLERWVFGRKSERFIPDIPGQPTLFSVLEEPSVVAEVEKESIRTTNHVFSLLKGLLNFAVKQMYYGKGRKEYLDARYCGIAS